MKRSMPLRMESSNEPNPFVFRGIDRPPKRLFSWQAIHNKTLRTAGRGGKGHLMGGASLRWNRKGRWFSNESKKPS